MRDLRDEEAIASVVWANLAGQRAAGVVALIGGILLAVAVGSDELGRARGGNELNLAAWAVVAAALVGAAAGGAVLVRGLRARAHPLFRTLTGDGPAIESVQVVAALHRPVCQVRLGLAGGRSLELVVPGDAARARSLLRHVAPRARLLELDDARSGAPLDLPGLVFGTQAEEVLRLDALVERQIRPLRRVGLGLSLSLPAGAAIGWLEWTDAGLDGPAPDTAIWAFCGGAALALVGVVTAWRNRRAETTALYDVLVTHRAEITDVEVVRVVNSWADRVIVRSPRAGRAVTLLVDHRERDATVELLSRACGKVATSSDAIEPR